MKRVTQIHAGRTPVRRHFIQEWLEARNMSAMDLLEALNDSGEDPIDKSQVYRWLRGNLPHVPTQIRIAAALNLVDPDTGAPDPEALLRDPDQDWIARRLKGKSKEEIERIKQMIDLAFPEKTGTDN